MTSDATIFRLYTAGEYYNTPFYGDTTHRSDYTPKTAARQIMTPLVLEKERFIMPSFQ